MIHFHTTEEAEKEMISAWRYEGSYAIYNLPPYEEQKAKKMAFGNPERSKNFHSYFEGDCLIGFTHLLEKEEEVLIGIGVNPCLCGRGYGQQILLLAEEISQKAYPGMMLALEVRTWNSRAISCYEKAGFQKDGAAFVQETPIGNGEFYRMIKTQPHQTVEP